MPLMIWATHVLQWQLQREANLGRRANLKKAVSEMCIRDRDYVEYCRNDIVDRYNITKVRKIVTGEMCIRDRA